MHENLCLIYKCDVKTRKLCFIIGGLPPTLLVASDTLAFFVGNFQSFQRQLILSQDIPKPDAVQTQNKLLNAHGKNGVLEANTSADTPAQKLWVFNHHKYVYA